MAKTSVARTSTDNDVFRSKGGGVSRMIIVDILAGLAGAVAGFLGVGFLAARVLVGALGNHDGGSDMAGFFFFGPIGGLAGAMLGVGLAMRLGAGGAVRAKRVDRGAWPDEQLSGPGGCCSEDVSPYPRCSGAGEWGLGLVGMALWRRQPDSIADCQPLVS